MSKVEDILRQKLSPEDFEIAKQILNLPVSRIRGFIQEIVDEVETE